MLYLHTDHLLTARYASDAGGSTVWTWDSGAFGVEAPTGSATVNLRFPGQYYDSETGLHYNWHRYYDPATGRYITSDPLGLAAGLNTYGYAAQNPLSFHDPDGRLLPALGAVLYGAGAWLTGAAISQTIADGIDLSQGDITWGEFWCRAAWNWGLPAAVSGAGKIFRGVGALGRILGGFGDDIGRAVSRGGDDVARAAGGADDVARAAPKPRGTQNPKVKAAAEYGKKKHKTWNPGAGYDKEVRLPSGKRADAVNWNERHVKELKPNNPRATKAGQKQVEDYKKELEEITGQCWTCSVETYD